MRIELHLEPDGRVSAEFSGEGSEAYHRAFGAGRLITAHTLDTTIPRRVFDAKVLREVRADYPRDTVEWANNQIGFGLEPLQEEPTLFMEMRQ
jgi:hypothetical protein